MAPDIFAAMGSALGLLLDPMVLLYICLGAVIGGLMSVIPGVGGILGLALLLPFTFSMTSYEAVAFMLGALAVLSTTDTIPAILFGVPGTATSMVTVIDGYPMSKRGESGRALGAALSSSILGGVLGVVPLIVVIPIMMPIMMATTSPELVAICVLGLAMVATLSGGAMFKGLAAATLGILLALVGADAQTATMRWTGGQMYLWDGVSILVVFLGIYAIPELADMAIQGKTIAKDADKATTARSPLRGALTGVGDMIRNWWLVARSSGISSALGVLPAIGPAVIPWMVYSYASMSTKSDNQFGRGDVRGVIAAESSNNATVGGSLLPTIALGIPGSAPMALLLAAFLLHGIAPGPDMITRNLDFTYMMIWAVVVANIVGGLFAFALCVPLSRVVFLRTSILVPLIIAVVFIGSVQSSREWLDLVAVLAIGLFGWLMKRARWPRAPFALAFILAPLVEQYFNISMRIHGWSWIWRPAVLVMGIATLLFLLFVAVRQLIKVRKTFSNKIKFAPALSVEAGLAIFTVLVGGAAYISATDWPTLARQIPQLTGIAAVAMGAGALFTAWTKPVIPENVDAEVVQEVYYDVTTDFGDLSRAQIAWRGILYFVLLVAFGILAYYIGMMAALPIFAVGYMLVHKEKPLTALIVGIGAGIVAYLVFDWFLRLPWPVPAMDLVGMTKSMITGR